MTFRDQTDSLPEPGKTLEHLRLKLALQPSDVERESRELFADDPRFHISHSWLHKIEKCGSTPSIFGIYVFSRIYNVDFRILTQLYGVPIDQNPGEMPGSGHQHIVVEVCRAKPSRRYLVRSAPNFRLQQTRLFRKVDEVFRDSPSALTQFVEGRAQSYAYLGSDTISLVPAVRSGMVISLQRERTPDIAQCGMSVEQPVYLVRGRDRYYCANCDVRKGEVILLPDPRLEKQPVRRLAVPADAEVQGRVHGVVMRLAASALPFTGQKVAEQASHTYQS